MEIINEFDINGNDLVLVLEERCFGIVELVVLVSFFKDGKVIGKILEKFIFE